MASGPHFFSDPVSLSTKSHSQQQQPPAALGSVPHSAPEPRPQDGSPAPHPLPPPLCISTGATVPYFAEGCGGPVPTSSTLILPPEYSSWGYPYGEWRPGAWRGGSAPGPMQTWLSPRRGPAVLRAELWWCGPWLDPGELTPCHLIWMGGPLPWDWAPRTSCLHSWPGPLRTRCRPLFPRPLPPDQPLPRPASSAPQQSASPRGLGPRETRCK